MQYRNKDNNKLNILILLVMKKLYISQSGISYIKIGNEFQGIIPISDTFLAELKSVEGCKKYNGIVWSECGMEEEESLEDFCKGLIEDFEGADNFPLKDDSYNFILDVCCKGGTIEKVLKELFANLFNINVACWCCNDELLPQGLKTTLTEEEFKNIGILTIVNY